MSSKKLEIQKVDNGFIVRWIDTGQSAFKEPFEGMKPVLVYNSYEDLVDHLFNNLRDSKAVARGP